MASPLEIVTVVVGNTLAVGQLLLAVHLWRSARHQTTHITIQRDGNKIEIDLDDPGEAEGFVRDFIARAAKEARAAE
ncbi:hypothetical protein [Actinoplanes sp. N902-109]|uniref:effector-associated constant component EACC1 n=1 Tax=Actinoplanes sp. (strain N902-109) TaxID=649831 RepID=UPI0012F8ADE0|nr:hypothetical protein [Actinoplanes sp. N902-109]